MTPKTYEIPGDFLAKFRKVLIVEDDSAVANLLSDTLQVSGWIVSLAADGKYGIRHVLASDFDVILCDMVMPNFPGDIFYRAVERARPHLCSRFLFMTGHRANPQIDAFIRSVRGLLLWKPFRMDELRTAMDAVLRRSELQRAKIHERTATISDT